MKSGNQRIDPCMRKMPICACGCGQEIVIKPHHKYKGIPRYINFHYLKSSEGRKEKSDAVKNQEDGYGGDYRVRISCTLKDRPFSKETRDKISYALKGNTNQDLSKLTNGFQKWRKTNPQKHRDHQRKAGVKGGIATTILQTKHGFLSQPEKTMRLWLPTDFIHNIRLGRYFPDFMSDQRMMIIEVDGVHWHTKPDHIERDRKKDNFYRLMGYKVSRITDLAIINTPDLVQKELKILLGDNPNV